MASHIGVVTVSAPGAALCYETIASESAARLGAHEHPKISLNAFSGVLGTRLLARTVDRAVAAWPGTPVPAGET